MESPNMLVAFLWPYRGNSRDDTQSHVCLFPDSKGLSTLQVPGFPKVKLGEVLNEVYLLLMSSSSALQMIPCHCVGVGRSLCWHFL